MCKQAIIKPSLVYSFQQMFFIGQNLKHVHKTYSFLKLLIFSCLGLFLTTPKKYCMWIQLHGKPIMNLFLLLMLKKPGLFNVKLKLISFSFFSIWVFFLSRTFTIHRTAGEEGRYLFNSSLPLPPASQTLRH